MSKEKSKERSNYFKLIGKINKQAKKEESYNTGLLGEHLIIASYKQMPVEKLEKVRVIINRIIKEKKEYKRVQSNNTK